MKIQIHHIPSHGLDLTFEEKAARFPSVKELMDSGECAFPTTVAIALQVTPMPDLIRVNGNVSTTARQGCVRCLELFDHRLEGRFVLNYSKAIPDDLHREDKETVELTAQQIGIVHYQGEEIDFSDAIQEQIVLTVPYQPLCRDDCKGLCARCGKNLNVDACSCGDQATGGPFDALKALKLPSE